MGDTGRPNVVLIHSDQHRYDCLGTYGNDDVRTPHIDALAADGVTYENSFCPYPICTPSRYSMLSGLHAHQHPGRGNGSTLPSGLTTFPELLGDAGYRTRGIGKMHFTPRRLDVGLDELELSDRPAGDDDSPDMAYYEFLEREGVRDWSVADLFGWSEDLFGGYGAAESVVDEEHHVTTWTGDRSLRALEDWDESTPEFLFVSFNRPHRPFDPPEPWDDLYDPEDLSLLPGWTEDVLERDAANGFNMPMADMTAEEARRTTAYYYACISHVDHQVGRIVDRLKATGEYEDTLIIYTSDHGEYMGFHHMMGKINHMYDPTVRIPMVVKYPGNERAGERSERLVNSVDLAPTILEQAGCERGECMTGEDLSEPGGERDVVFAEFGGYMVRSENRKLIRRQDPDESLFFDLDEDPHETENRYDDPAYREEVAAFEERLHRWLLFEAPTATNRDPDAPVVRE